MLTFAVDTSQDGSCLILHVQSTRTRKMYFGTLAAFRHEIESILSGRPAGDHSNAWETLAKAADFAYAIGL